MTRKELLRRLGGLAVGSTLLPTTLLPSPSFATTTSPRKPKSGKPNVLWLTLEGVPISMLSCYGSKIVETPNIDRIAKEGMRFQNAFCTNALCAPGRATLLTGKYCHANGMLTNPGDTTQGQTSSTFDPTQPTFPKMLRAAGYQTGMVGKWHLVDKDQKPSNPGVAGFDYFVFKEGAGGPYYQSTGYFQNPTLGSTDIEPREYPGYCTDNFTDLAISGMKQFKQPFLMMVQFFNDHRPFDPPHKYEHIYDDVRFTEPGTFWDDYSNRASPANDARMRIEYMPDFAPPDDLTGRQRKQWNYQQFMRHFSATLKSLDDNVGRLLNYLDANHLTDNTIVVVTGDHGFFMGDHGWFDKRFMYEPSIRIPWMIRYPGTVAAGTTHDAMTINVDNAPTILELLGLAVPTDMHGKSLATLVKGGTADTWRDAFYYHYYEFAPPHWVVPHYGVRTERYKLINYYTINEWELFDLEKDPDEMENLFEWAGYKVHPDYETVAKDLVQKLSDLRDHFGDTTGAPVKLWPTSSYD